ncbi:hypothetical protein ACRPOS_007295 [Bartonella heixiaziensis]|uniref:hypothetical protein n=1 Tax=Bartonella heixiaziensis TaxID=1461000 RepID=UPI00390889E9
MWGDRTLLSVYVLLEVIAVCVVAFIPVMLGLYIVFTVGVKKNIQRLKELTGKHHKINHLQNDLYKKGMRGKVNNRLMEFLALGLMLVTIFTSNIIIYILLFYYSTFKRARLYFQVKKERKSVLKERDMFV